MEYLRIYKAFEIAEVQQHLLIMGDLSGDCANCRALGINPYEAEKCPECGAEFKYVTSRRLETHPSERFQLVRRVFGKRPHWLFIDYTDYTKTLGQKKARDFFG